MLDDTHPSHGSRRFTPLLVWALPLLLVADPARAARPCDKKRAQELFEQAEVQYRAGQMQTALERYKSAYLACPRPHFLFNFAQCYRELGDLENAIRNYELYLSDWARWAADHGKASQAPNREEVERTLTALRQDRDRKRAEQEQAARRKAAEQEQRRLADEKERKLALERARPAAAPAAAPDATAVSHAPSDAGPSAERGNGSGSGLWLGLGIGAGVLAAAGLGVGIGLMADHNSRFNDDPSLGALKGGSMAGYVPAGVMAAASAAAFVIYGRRTGARRASAPSARDRAWGFALLPVAGGAAASGTLPFD